MMNEDQQDQQGPGFKVGFLLEDENGRIEFEANCNEILEILEALEKVFPPQIPQPESRRKWGGLKDE